MSKLIELDAAIAETWKDTEYTDPLNVMTALRDRLEALPTVDAVPIRHGRWVSEYKIKPSKETDAYHCSVCHDYYTTESYNLRYCPRCGAKMDGKGDSNETD